ncbi:FAD-dependent oxidoreductase [Chloroflexota bacterium]
MTTQKLFETDVLIIGAGTAGCRAACRARDLGVNVALVDKGVVGRSGASPFAHGMLAPCPPGAQTDWLKEVVEQSEYLADQDWIEAIVEEQGPRIRELIDWGVSFDTDEQGNLLHFPGRGHVVSGLVNFNGPQMMDRLREAVIKKGVAVFERVMITDLLTSDGVLPTAGEVVGAIGLHTQKGDPLFFKAKAVVIATGPFTSKSHLVMFVNELTGDGQAAAFRAGAELTGMEFATHGTFSYLEKAGIRLLGQSKFQGLGATFINGLGEKVMDKYDPVLKERATFALIGQALVNEVLEGRGPIYLDMRHFSDEVIEQLWRILPQSMRGLTQAGLDIQKAAVEIKPVASLSGTGPGAGIKVGVSCETNIPRLYAAGNAAKVPQGVANWGGVPQAFANVSGYRAGENAAKTAKTLGDTQINRDQGEKLRTNMLVPLTNEGVTADRIFHDINKIVNPALNYYFKSQQRIDKVLSEIRRITDAELPSVSAHDAHELTKANEARNVVLLAELVYLAASHRQESRGPHYREEYPFRDDKNWLKWLVLKYDQGKTVVREESIPLDRYPLKPETLSIIPHPVQVKNPEARQSMVQMSTELCPAGCYICVDSCPVDAIRLDEQGKPFLAYPDDCTSCLLCETDCPVSAIKVVMRVQIPTELLPY